MELPLAPSLDPAFIEREYNNRALVPDHPEFFARWQRDSEFVRSSLPCKRDLAYGPDARHRLDVFPAANARGTLVFIHGGYWRALDKDMFSWLASSWVAAGVNVALVNYRLAPAVRIGTVVEDIVAATNWLMLHEADHGLAMERVVVSGHSAGGHLVAALFATPRSRLAFDPRRIVGGMALSGLYDFEPLRHFSFNTDFRLDPAAVAQLNLYDKRPTIAAPLVAAAGAAESSEFQRNAHLLAAAWPTVRKPAMILPSLHHFSIVDAFAERSQPPYEETLRFFS
jgi:arylformamidase